MSGVRAADDDDDPALEIEIIREKHESYDLDV